MRAQLLQRTEDARAFLEKGGLAALAGQRFISGFEQIVRVRP